MKELKKPYQVFVAFFIGIFIHFAQVANAFYNGDTLGVGDFFKCNLWDLSQGRFGLLFFSDRVINGTMEIVIAVMVYAVSSVIVLDILDIRNGLIALLVQIVFMSQPHFAFYTSFLYVVAPYSLAYFLSIFSVWLVKKNVIYEDKKHRVLYISMAIFSLTFSLAIWQGYIPTFTSLVFLLILFTDEVKNKQQVLIGSAGVGGVSVICYIILMKAVNLLFNVEITEARGFQDTLALNIPIVTQPMQTIKDIYCIFVNYLFRNDIVYNGFGKQITHLVLGILGIYCLYIWLKNKSREDKVVNIIILCLGPFAFVFYRCVSILCVKAPWTYLHSMIFVWILLLTLIGRIEIQKVGRVIGGLFILIIIYSQIYICNTGYSSLQERNLKSYAMATTMFTRISESEGWTINTPVMLYGNMDEVFEDKNYYYDEILKGWMPQVNEFLPYSGMPQNWVALINKLYGTQISMVDYTWEEWDQILECDEFRKLDIWPSKHSMRIIDDILVIKLNEYETK